MLGVLGAASSVALGAAGSTVLFLASNKGTDMTPAQCAAKNGCGPVVVGPTALKSNHTYLISVTGTVSAWAFWVKHPCGKPESAPEYPTPGLVTPTSDDAQFRFSIHLRCGRKAVPFKTTYFQMNLGHGWFHPIALGNPSQPSGNVGMDQHPYMFLVTGLGRRPGFRFVDNHPSDNDGKFKIVISQAS